MSSDSALVQELASTREALRYAIELGERLQACIDTALAIAEPLTNSAKAKAIVAALKGTP